MPTPSSPRFDALVPVVPGTAVPPPPSPPPISRYQDFILVTKDTRIVVKSAWQAEMNGLYLAHPEMTSNKIRLVKENNPDYSVIFKRKTQAQARVLESQGMGLYRLAFAGEALYVAESNDWRNLPTIFQSRDPKVAAQYGNMEVVDVTKFSELCLELGAFQAVYAEIANAVQQEVAGSKQEHKEKRAGQKSANRVSPHQVTEDEEDIQPGDMVLVTNDGLQQLCEHLEEAGLPWDERMAGMLGALPGYKVVELPNPKVVTVALTRTQMINLPIEAVEEITDIAAAYSNQPIFICIQTFVCAVFWLVFSIRDGGRGGQSWIQMMGGLESIFPGGTGLVFNRDCADFRMQIWRFWTYQFTHVGIMHIASNVFMNMVLGLQLEKFHGTIRMVVMYELGVLGGGLCYLLTDNHKSVVGTSGGCFALIGIRVGDLMMNWAERPYRWWRLAFLSLLVVLNFLVEMLHHTEGGVSTSNAAHVGGGLMGLVAGICIGRNLKLSKFETNVKKVVCALAVITSLVCLCIGFQWPPRNLFEPEPWCWLGQVSNMTKCGTWDWVCVRCDSESCIKSWQSEKRFFTATMEQCHERGGFHECLGD